MSSRHRRVCLALSHSQSVTRHKPLHNRAIVCCGCLMLKLPAKTWWRFFLWMTAGLVFYFLYGFRHSHLRNGV